MQNPAFYGENSKATNILKLFAAWLLPSSGEDFTLQFH